jgi:hypothetical protein
MSQKLITIVVPTFRRNEILAASLPRLLEQVTDECEVIILDNASPVPVAQTIGSMIAGRANVRVVRNRFNVGLSGNLMRAFEVCSTRWLWILGDDDPPVPTAVAQVIARVKENPEALLLNFSTVHYRRPQDFQTRGLAAFVAELDNFSSAVFISTNIYNAERMQPQLNIGVAYSYSTIPHFALLVASLTETDVAMFFSQKIVDQNAFGSIESWPMVTHYMGAMTVLELLPTSALQRKMAKLMLQTFPELRSLATQLVLSGERTGDSARSLYVFRQSCYRMHYFGRRPAETLKAWAFSWAIRFPWVGARLARLAYSMMRGSKLTPLQDVRSRL